MALAEFKDLCIDAGDPLRVGQFWATATGLTFERANNRLVGPTPQHRIWIAKVPESHEVKNRVHLDLDADSIGPLLQAGATVLSSSTEEQPWTILADPEGNELCVFVREPGSMEISDYRIFEMVCDSHDPLAQAKWWQSLLGGHLRSEEERAWYWLEDVPGVPFSSWVFVEVPECKQVKNRVHWDIYAPDVQPLLEAGAKLLRSRTGWDLEWSVLADPEGNEFCVFDPKDRV